MLPLSLTSAIPSLLAFLSLTLPTSALPARLKAGPFGVVISPKNGAMIDVGQSLHFVYACATQGGRVEVELVSYDPFAVGDAEDTVKEEKMSLATFHVGDPQRKYGVIDAWLGVPNEEYLLPSYDRLTYKLLVTESKDDYLRGQSFAEAPFIKIQGLQGTSVHAREEDPLLAGLAMDP